VRWFTPTPAFRTLLDVRVTILDYGELDTLPKLKIDGSSDPQLLTADEAAGGSPFKSQRRRGTPVDGSMRERLEKALDALADLDPDELRTLPGEDLKWLAQDRAVEIRHRAGLLLAILNHRIGPGC
jgi:hypothetical protein